MTVAGSDVANRLDRLPVTSYHRYVIAVVGVATFFDLYDLFLASTVSLVLVTDFGASASELKPLIASAFVGASIGALTIGRLGDRIGRRQALLVSLGFYSVFSLVGAFSTDIWMLVVCRFLAGVGIGAELPLVDAYIADLVPPSVRGRATAWAFTIGFCGVPIAGFLARGLVGRTLLGFEGWRWLFLVGAIGSLAVWILRTGLPESPRWLSERGSRAEAENVVRRFERSAGVHEPERDDVHEERRTDRPERTRVGALLSRPWRTRTVMLYVFHILQSFGYYGFGSLVPIVLTAKGFDLAQSLTFTALTFLGYPVGSALSLPVMERFQRPRLIIGSAVGMAVFGLAFGYSSTEAGIVVFGFCYTAVSNFFANTFHTYQAELFPTSLRATAAGSAYSISRLATAAMPYVLLPVLDAYGATAMFLVVAVAMTLLVIDIAALGPDTTGLSLESISPEG
ncbi:MFS transporter [Pseudonocardia alaniniphila]|uniref:MFS transporter n=1 Tax=Pseudonocardia alaniniphila TaxID=75291 RepID=A0ABS9TQS6_9PSEU|nr:MFS transporter [Pseudonocardia alaniniphila]MCH6170897.1 MFS transporter [Pseudonocardia alaniniphila]